MEYQGMGGSGTAKAFTVPDSASVSEALEIFKKTYSTAEFLTQEQVSFAIQLLENPKYSINIFGDEFFPGRTSLARHDYFQAICNAAGDPAGEAFIVGLTMASTGKMTKFKSWLYLLLANIFYPKGFGYDARARTIFYRTVEECTKLAKSGVLKDISIFPIETRTADSVGSVRKQLGLDAILAEIPYLSGGKV